MYTLRQVVQRLRWPPARPASIVYRAYSTATKVCPSCNAPLPSALPTCPNCLRIEPLPKSISYFDILGLPSHHNRFSVDSKTLKTRFLQAQRVCHPDAWSAKGEKVQSIAAAQSVLVNDAYRTLHSPVLRAQYILAQEGYPPSETDKMTDPELVTEILEARELLEDSDTVEAVADIRASNAIKMHETYSLLEKLIGEGRWEDAVHATVRLKYLEGIESAAREKWNALDWADT